MDDGAFEELYAAQYGDLLRYALRRVQEPADAADVVAETWVIAWRRRGDLPPNSERRLWLFGVARRVLANQRRGQLRRSRGFVPGDLRAALFLAATYIPGVNVTDKQANLDGRVGTAIGRDEGNATRQEIIFDPPTGQVIGERVVALDGSGTGIPSGETIEFTAVNTTVVSNLPTSALHP